MEIMFHRGSLTSQRGRLFTTSEFDSGDSFTMKVMETAIDTHLMI